MAGGHTGFMAEWGLGPGTFRALPHSGATKILSRAASERECLRPWWPVALRNARKPCALPSGVLAHEFSPGSGVPYSGHLPSGRWPLSLLPNAQEPKDLRPFTSPATGPVTPSCFLVTPMPAHQVLVQSLVDEGCCLATTLRDKFKVRP